MHTTMGTPGILFTLLVVVTGFYFSGILSPTPGHPQVPKDGWWGRGPKVPADDTTIREFKISVSNKTLQDLKQRLNNARLGEDLENASFDYGFQVSYMKEVLEYWKTNYDWRKQEEILNSYPHFKTKIEGIDVHFLRAKPVTPAKGTIRPLLMVHGWPSSIVEFYRILPILTDPAKHGFSADDAFEVICPSIPGFGFSEAPHQKGFDYIAAARIFVTLMERLGYDTFYFQGGDWGALIGTMMSAQYPEHIQGVHLNTFLPLEINSRLLLRQLVLAVWPSALLNQDEIKLWQGRSTYKMLLREFGYFHLQATRPDTVAFGLNDSPVGLAAYILEKFSVWTHPDNRHLPDGGLTQDFTLDELLTNVMVYWVTGSIGPSVRYYKENVMSEWIPKLDRVPVTVPAGLASFPQDPGWAPHALAEVRFHNIVQFTNMPSGGHFVAAQEPKLMAEDLINFARKVEKK